MKEKKLISEMYKACFNRDHAREAHLRKLQYSKILKRKAKGKKFDAKWTILS
jgi:hypothetical protein